MNSCFRLKKIIGYAGEVYIQLIFHYCKSEQSINNINQGSVKKKEAVSKVFKRKWRPN
jgi:hypothetical protein